MCNYKFYGGCFQTEPKKATGFCKPKPRSAIFDLDCYLIITVPFGRLSLKILASTVEFLTIFDNKIVVVSPFLNLTLIKTGIPLPSTHNSTVLYCFRTF